MESEAVDLSKHEAKANEDLSKRETQTNGRADKSHLGEPASECVGEVVVLD